jgi:hypothetical protein
MIKIFTEPYYTVGDSVNTWLKENEDTVEVTKITQSSCYRNSGGTSQIYITVMIEYIELITDFGYSTIYPPLV